MKYSRLLIVFCVFMSFSTIQAGWWWWDDDDMTAQERMEEIQSVTEKLKDELADEDYEDAGDYCLRLSELSTNRKLKASWLMKAADYYLDAHEGYDAMTTYKKLLETYPLLVPYDHVVVRLRKLAEEFAAGDCTFWSMKDETRAIRVYEMLIRESPSNQVTVQDRFRLAELLIIEKRYEEAVAVYQAIIKLNNRDMTARAKLALLLHKLSEQTDGDGARNRASIREAEIVLKYSPEHPLAGELKAMLKRAEELSAARLVTQAEFYLLETSLRPGAARRYLYDVIKEYPNTEAAVRAKELLKTNPDILKWEATDAKNEAPEVKNPAADTQR